MTALALALPLFALGQNGSWYVGCKGRLVDPGSLRVMKGVYVSKNAKGAAVLAAYAGLTGDGDRAKYLLTHDRDLALVPLGSKATVTKVADGGSRLLGVVVTSGPNKGLRGDTVWFYTGEDYLWGESVVLRSNLKSVAGAFSKDDLDSFYEAWNAHDRATLQGLLDLKRVVALNQGTKGELHDYTVADDLADLIRDDHPEQVGKVEEGDALRVRVSGGKHGGSLLWVRKKDMTVTYPEAAPTAAKKAVGGRKRGP